MTDYATDWVARRHMISHAETSEGSRHIKDPITHTNKMAKRYGEIYREAVVAAYGSRDSQACAAVVCDRIDAVLSERHGWKTIAQFNADEIAAMQARRLNH